MKIEEPNFEFEENTPAVKPTDPNPDVVISNQDLLGSISHNPTQDSLNHTIVPWVKVGLLGVLVQLILGITWGILLNAEQGLFKPIQMIANRVFDLQAILYLAFLPISYKVLKRWAVDVPFVIASFSVVFLYGMYRLGQTLPIANNLRSYLIGVQVDTTKISVANPYFLIAMYLLTGVFIYSFATFATNASRLKVLWFGLLLLVAFGPYIYNLLNSL